MAVSPSQNFTFLDALLRGGTGPAGATGPAGVSTGVTGPPGPTGARGPTGPQGVGTGATGPQGPTGQRGATGAPGVTGATGPVGFTGPQGSPGFTGPTGPVGTRGPTGSIGPQGVTGPQGAQGSPGSTGPQGGAGSGAGAQGSPGVTGAQGIQGSQGVTGATGLRGATGTIGPQGPTGTPGSTGPQGVTGPPGFTGPQGSPGVTGPQGPTGQRGATGATGPQGAGQSPGYATGQLQVWYGAGWTASNDLFSQDLRMQGGSIKFGTGPAVYSGAEIRAGKNFGIAADSTIGTAVNPILDYADDTIVFGDGSTLIEATQLADGRRIVAINVGQPIPSAYIPTGMGDLVAFVGNVQASGPFVTPGAGSGATGGYLFYGQTGAAKVITEGGVVNTVAPAINYTGSPGQNFRTHWVRNAGTVRGSVSSPNGYVNVLELNARNIDGVDMASTTSNVLFNLNAYVSSCNDTTNSIGAEQHAIIAMMSGPGMYVRNAFQVVPQPSGFISTWTFAATGTSLFIQRAGSQQGHHLVAFVEGSAVQMPKFS
jgi:hypothetical protein